MDWFDLPISAPPKIASGTMSSPHGQIPGHHEYYRLENFRYGDNSPGANGIWCVNLYGGPGQVVVDGRAYRFESGYAGFTCPGHDLEYVYDQPSKVGWIHFVPPIRGATIRIPVMQNLGEHFDHARSQLMELVGYFPYFPIRAEAVLWNLLWMLSDGIPQDNSEQKPSHPAVRRAVSFIEQHLLQPLTVQSIAQQVNLSPTHLLRLFTLELGTPLMSYVRKRRIQMAANLLITSDKPIKVIAAEMGFADSQSFNHTVHRVLNKSPSEVREGK